MSFGFRKNPSQIKAVEHLKGEHIDAIRKINNNHQDESLALVIEKERSENGESKMLALLKIIAECRKTNGAINSS